MRPHFLSVSLFSLASGFSTTKRCLLLPQSPLSRGTGSADSNIVLSAEESASVSDSPKQKPLSPKEILEQQRAKQGLPDPDNHPKLFSDELLHDMKEILLLLEKRVQGGKGSISAAEVDKFVTMSGNVLVEMKQKEYERLDDSTPSSPGVSSGITTTATTAIESSTNTLPTAAADEIYDPEVEGPDYSPLGGQGSIPKDTTNTYIIPGMDEMAPEEYRKALQESIIARQDRRRSKGAYGNRNTWDYLNNLSGDTGVLKKKDESES